jgi:hypothetical protein
MVGLCFAALVLSSCASQRLTAGSRREHTVGEPHEFIMPYDAAVYVSPAGGTGAAVSEFGVCFGDSECKVILRGLPSNPSPADEVKVGDFTKGEVICFCMKTAWRGEEYLSRSSNRSALSQIAFRDLDNSLKLRRGRTAERIAPDMWILHLDDGASFLYDDNDRDVLIRIRLDSGE